MTTTPKTTRSVPISEETEEAPPVMDNTLPDGKTHHDPETEVGLVGESRENPEYIHNPNDNHMRTRVILVGTTHYEHVGDDADGVWLYRAY